MRTRPFTAPLHAVSQQALNKLLQTRSKIKSCEYGKWQGFKECHFPVNFMYTT